MFDFGTTYVYEYNIFYFFKFLRRPRRHPELSRTGLTHVAIVVEIQRGKSESEERSRQQHSTGYNGQVAFQVCPPLPPCWVSGTKRKANVKKQCV